MTRSLFRALTARLGILGLSGLMLGGLACQAAATRPAPVDRTFTMEFEEYDREMCREWADYAEVLAAAGQESPGESAVDVQIAHCRRDGYLP